MSVVLAIEPDRAQAGVLRDVLHGTPGVQLEGVGNRVAHNLFYNAPSSVMVFWRSTGFLAPVKSSVTVTPGRETGTPRSGVRMLAVDDITES